MQVYYTILYRQKKLQEENVARKISQLLQLFLLQQYNFSQFALFSSCNLYSKGSSRHPLLINFLIFFAPSPPLLIPTPPVYYFFEFVQARSNRPNFSWVVQIPPYPFFLPVYQIFGKIPPHLFILPPSFIKYLGKCQIPGLFPGLFIFTYLYPPQNRKSLQAFLSFLISYSNNIT